MESHDYIMKIVPTVYEDISGNRIVSYQYTYAYKVGVRAGPLASVGSGLFSLSRLLESTRLCPRGLTSLRKMY